MASLLKVKVKWTGFTGGPGWSNFYFGQTNDGEFMTQDVANAAAVKTEQFFNSCAVAFPAVVKSTVQSDVEQLNVATGKLEGIWTVPTRAGTAGTNAGTTYSGPAGMVVTWRTSAVRKNRLMRGRTFLVPTAVNTFETDGTIVATIINSVSTAATALIADDPVNLDFGVYARPVVDANGVVQLEGAWANCSSFTVPDKVAILRSRRE